jgi:putative membrane protein
MQKLAIGTAVIALTAVMSVGTAEAATVGPTTAKPSAQDGTWMKSNAQTDLAEIAIGKLAMAKSHNADLLKVAKVTMENHKTVLAKLKVLAKKEGVKLPAAPNASQQKDAKELESLSGSKFNLAWDNIQITGHKLSIAQTETEISKGSASAVISFAKYYLPIAKMHLSMVEKLHHQLT